jgi:hypothetical protein
MKINKFDRVDILIIILIVVIMIKIYLDSLDSTNTTKISPDKIELSKETPDLKIYKLVICCDNKINKTFENIYIVDTVGKFHKGDSFITTVIE